MAKQVHTKLVALRMPQGMFDELKGVSEKNGIKLSELVRRYLEKGLREVKRGTGGERN